MDAIKFSRPPLLHRYVAFRKSCRAPEARPCGSLGNTAQTPNRTVCASAGEQSGFKVRA
jgi:hypothetical protein